MVAVVLAINTIVVVVMQHRFSKYSETVNGALRSLRLSALAFSLMALVFAFAADLGGWPVIAAILVIGFLLTFGEMLESPAWWTLSFEFAPKGRSDEYLAAFDLCFAALNIAGPPAIVLLVEHGSIGWFAYLAAVAVATTYVHAVLSHTRSTESVGEPA